MEITKNRLNIIKNSGIKLQNCPKILDRLRSFAIGITIEFDSFSGAEKLKIGNKIYWLNYHSDFGNWLESNKEFKKQGEV